MHIPPFDNQNRAIIDVHNEHVPLTYFNIVKLEKESVFLIKFPDMRHASCQLQAVLMWMRVLLDLAWLETEVVMFGMVNLKEFMCQQICLHRWFV